MTNELQIILLIVSSVIGYLARMKIKSKCGCCECEIERDDNNKVKRVSVARKDRSQRDLSVDTSSRSSRSSRDELSAEARKSPKIPKQQSGTL